MHTCSGSRGAENNKSNAVTYMHTLRLCQPTPAFTSQRPIFIQICTGPTVKHRSFYRSLNEDIFVHSSRKRDLLVIHIQQLILMPSSSVTDVTFTVCVSWYSAIMWQWQLFWQKPCAHTVSTYNDTFVYVYYYRVVEKFRLR